MKLFFKKILLTCTCFFLFAHLFSQVNVYATASPEQINKDGYFTYKIIVANADNVQNITPPPFKNFTVVSGPMQESGMSSSNGNTTQYIGLQYVLKPSQAGNLRIDAASALIAGKVYKTSPVIIKVKNVLSASAAPSNLFSAFTPFAEQQTRPDFNDNILHKEDNIADKVNKNMQLRLEVDKTRCYVGEPVIASYKLYTRLKSESKMIQNPSFNGFSVIDIQRPEITGYSAGKLNGRDYNVYTIRKSQIYALQPGVISLEPAEIENNIEFIKEEYANMATDMGSLFNNFSGSFFPTDAIVKQTVNLKSTATDITVKPLPELNKPASFNGAVGNFSIEASLQRPLFSTTEAGKLSVTISGSGNMQLLTAPDITWPKGIEAFEPKVSDALSTTTVPVSGSKKFEYTFSATDTGHFVMPSIHFSFFNPAKVTYKTVTTDSLYFQVIKGSSRPALAANIQSSQPSLSGKSLHNPWWIIVLATGIILASIIIWILTKKKTADKNLPEMQVKSDEKTVPVETHAFLIVQNPFTETEKCLRFENYKDFYQTLNSELKNYLSEKFSLHANTIHSNNIVSILTRQEISNDTLLRLQRLMYDLEWKLYTPVSDNENMSGIFHEANTIVKEINSNDIRSR